MSDRDQYVDEISERLQYEALRELHEKGNMYGAPETFLSQSVHLRNLVNVLRDSRLSPEECENSARAFTRKFAKQLDSPHDAEAQREINTAIGKLKKDIGRR